MDPAVRRLGVLPVYTEMLLQVSREYSSLPDPRTLTLDEIRFYYDGLRGDLLRMTKRRTD